VLVVDDDPAALKLARMNLSAEGYRVVCVPDAESALRAIEADSPAAVVLDLLMPGIGGFEFLERFRQMPAGRRAVVIVWTVADLDSEELRRLGAMSQGVVSKGDGGLALLVEELRQRVPSGGRRR
jgi:CheY-like chemotaxis protein